MREGIATGSCGKICEVGRASWEEEDRFFGKAVLGFWKVYVRATEELLE